MIKVMGHGKMRKTVNIQITPDGKATPDGTTHLEYASDAHRLARVLERNLPSGTFDRLLKDLFSIHMRDYLDDQTIRQGNGHF
jgi:hypothetical protein